MVNLVIWSSDVLAIWTMVQALPQPLSFEEFLDWYPDGQKRYELIALRALGARRFTGYPKEPTLSVCLLVDGEYQIQPFRGDQPITSLAFPELKITATQIFQAGF